MGSHCAKIYFTGTERQTDAATLHEASFMSRTLDVALRQRSSMTTCLFLASLPERSKTTETRQQRTKVDVNGSVPLKHQIADVGRLRNCSAKKCGLCWCESIRQLLINLSFCLLRVEMSKIALGYLKIPDNSAAPLASCVNFEKIRWHDLASGLGL